MLKIPRTRIELARCGRGIFAIYMLYLVSSLSTELVHIKRVCRLGDRNLWEFHLKIMCLTRQRWKGSRVKIRASNAQASCVSSGAKDRSGATSRTNSNRNGSTIEVDPKNWA